MLSKTISEEERQQKLPSIPIAPNSEYTYIGYSGAELSEIQLDHIKTRVLFVYLCGKVWYDDIFNCAHWTKYCFRLNTQLEYEPCEEGENKVDDNACP